MKRLHRIEITKRPETDWMSFTGEDFLFPVSPDDPNLPHQWRDHCMNLWGEMKDFFLPSESKTYLSRSSARDKQRIVERWGGEAQILVADVGHFRPLKDAQREDKIRKLESQLRALRAEEGIPF